MLFNLKLMKGYFHSVARCCRDIPGALFPARVLVRPVWTAHHSLCTAQFMLTTSFFTVMVIFMQLEAISALAHIAPKGVDTFVLAATIVFGAFILIREEVDFESFLGYCVV